MREVNFSNPSQNKASVGITTTLYDRRALDCTSTLPLINSLNHLAYLTTSSARIREILTIDGGVERLVAILKNGRSKDMMDTWKWNLAFQCVVNIGIRGSDSKGTDNHGSENIRKRVVEADMVPVIATILDNYMQVVEKLKAKHEDTEGRRGYGRVQSIKRPFPRDEPVRSRYERRRNAPPAVEVLPSRSSQSDIPFRANEPGQVIDGSRTRGEDDSEMDIDGQISRSGPELDPNDETVIQTVMISQPPSSRSSRRPYIDPQQRDMRSITLDEPPTSASSSIHTVPPISAGLRFEPVPSQPESPTTPRATRGERGSHNPRSRSAELRPARSSGAHDTATSGDSDASENTETENDSQDRIEPVVGIHQDTSLEDLTASGLDLGDNNGQNNITLPEVSETAEADTFDMTHRPLDMGINDPNATPRNGPLGISPPPPPPPLPLRLRLRDGPPEAGSREPFQLQSIHRNTSTAILATVPRDEDVVMSLQLLAYVSKYCSLRPYFQESHLVPKLRINRELHALDGSEPPETPLAEVTNEEEYCQPDDYNIFPLVEKFTVKQHTPDMKYWACVVMRNLCRKDKAHGDIRQCAYYMCGKWENYARQFAKCRRCRQTKYCSKECQKAAWPAHRWWCDPAKEGQTSSTSKGHEHHHHHHHHQAQPPATLPTAD